MTFFNANAIAAMLDLSPSNFSNWMKTNINKLTDTDKYIIRKGKFVYYHPIIIKEICELRNTPVPEKVLSAIEKESYKFKAEQLKEFYEIGDLDDALDLLVRLQSQAQKENRRLEKENQRLEHENDLLFSKVDSLETQIRDMRDMYDKLLKVHEKFLQVFVYTDEVVPSADDDNEDVDFASFFNNEITDLDKKDSELK